MIELFISGVLLGSSNGAAPGPLSNLIISKTISHGKKEGFLLALAPLVSDVFIVSFSYFCVNSASNIGLIKTLLPFIGAVFILYLAVMGFIAKDNEESGELNYQLKDAVLVNLVNPYPYLFWIFVGIPLVVSSNAPWIFFLGFYLFFLATKVVIIYLVDIGMKNRTILVKKRVNKVLSVVLLYFVFKLIHMGVSNL
jgi:threonine/homoserine/homoserine lactone efflux protein